MGRGLRFLPPPFKDYFFYKNAVNKQKFSIELLRNLSKSAGNSHLETQSLKHFWGRMPPRPQETSRFRRAMCYSSPYQSSRPARSITRPAILQPWHLWVCKQQRIGNKMANETTTSCQLVPYFIV